MSRPSPLIEIHNAIWTVVAIPMGFAGGVFVLPGLEVLPGLLLLAVSGALIVYIARLSRGDRLAWMAGLAAHTVLVLAAPLYIPRWPDLLAIPLAAASLYSAIVLLLHREAWPSRAHETAPA